MPQLQDSFAVVAQIDPDAYTAATYTSDYVDMGKFSHIAAIIQVGEMAASSTVDCKLREATSAAGAGVKDITGKSITQLTQAGSDSDKQAVINLTADEVDKDNSFRYVQASMTVAAAASDASVTIIAWGARHDPATGSDLSSVVEIVA